MEALKAQYDQEKAFSIAIDPFFESNIFTLSHKFYDEIIDILEKFKVF